MAFREQDKAARQNLRDQALGFLDTPIEEFSRDTTLGLQGGFFEYRAEIERILILAKRVGNGDIDAVPFEQIERLRSAFEVASNALKRTLSFNLKQGPDERDLIGQALRDAARQLFVEAAPVLAAAFRPEEIASVADAEIKRVSAEWQQRLDAQAKQVDESRGKVDALRAEVTQTLEAAKTAAEDAGFSAQSTHFQEQAKEHNHSARGWLGASILLLAGIVSAALWSLDYYVNNPPGTGVPVNLQLLAAKVVLFSALFAGLIAATKSYRSHRHNYVVNKHRQNALLTFRAFSQQANADQATKNAVLLQATQCIFSPQVTGYSAQDGDSGYPPILEIVRSIASPEKR